MPKYLHIIDGVVIGTVNTNGIMTSADVVVSPDGLDHIGEAWNGAVFVAPAIPAARLPVWSSYRFSKLLGKSVWREAKNGGNEDLEFLSYLMERAPAIDMNDPEIFADIKKLVPSLVNEGTWAILKGE